MGQAHKLNNAIIVDQDTISGLWYLLHRLSDSSLLDEGLPVLEDLQSQGRHACVALSHKISQQGCCLSEEMEGWQTVLNQMIEENEYVGSE